MRTDDDLCTFSPDTRDVIRNLVKDSVHETLLSLGLTPASPSDMQKDMQHLRRMREAHELYRKTAITSLLGLAITGLGYMIHVVIDAMTTSWKQ